MKDQLALEHESSRGDNLVPVTQAGLDFDTVAARAANLHGSKRELLVIGFFPRGNEDVFLGFDLDNRVRRNGQDLFAAGAIQHDPHEHPQLEQVVGIISLSEE